MQLPRSLRVDGLAATDYYAPRCRIEVEGKELIPEIVADVLSVNVTLALDEPAAFSVTVNNWDTRSFAFKYTERRQIKNELGKLIDVGVFDLGNKVHVELGYADSLTSLVRGVITTLKPEFPESGPSTITVTGLDAMIMLRDRKPGPREQKKWTGKRDSEIAKDIARRNNLAAHVDESPIEQPLVMQKDQDDARFIVERAKRIDFDCYIGTEGDGATRRDTLFFVRPRDGRTSAAIRMFEFEWGKNLISFSPTLTLSRQVSKVTVRDWDSRNMEPIVATATAADLPKQKGKGKTGPQLAAEKLNDKQEIVVDAHVLNKDEAKALAIRLLAERAYEFVTASMSVMGNPALRPGDNVSVSRLGRRFDGEYYITKVDHTFGAAGFRTQLQVRRIHDEGLA
jgi:phage protein D